jgi:hypothetical protein
MARGKKYLVLPADLDDLDDLSGPAASNFQITSTRVARKAGRCYTDFIERRDTTWKSFPKELLLSPKTAGAK